MPDDKTIDILHLLVAISFAYRDFTNVLRMRDELVVDP